MVSDSGWMNTKIYLEWFWHFIKRIPPAQPVLLIQDVHSSHISIELIKLARENPIHLLWLPAHTTHTLQPLDVGSTKSAFSQACHRYVMQQPGRVVTTDVLASLVGEAWPHSFTSLNILSGVKKCRFQPFNPGEVSDRQLYVSKCPFSNYMNCPLKTVHHFLLKC